MSSDRSIRALLITVLLVGGFATACAKRPALTQASAPAPTGVAVAPAPAAPQPAAPPAPAPAPAPAPPPPPAAAAPTPPPPAPPPARAVPSEFAENPALADIHFDFDKSAIRPGDARILEANAAWLKQNPGTLVLIEGHADERGTNEYNLALGERRANATRDFLAARGVATNRMTLVSYGEERPACKERNERCWGQNRRSHFLTKRE